MADINFVANQRGIPSFEYEMCGVYVSPHCTGLKWSFFSILPHDIGDILPG